MRQTRILLPWAVLLILSVIAALISTVAVSGQQIAGGSYPADSIYARPGQLYKRRSKNRPHDAAEAA
jgi:hypothetical protein